MLQFSALDGVVIECWDNTRYYSRLWPQGIRSRVLEITSQHAERAALAAARDGLEPSPRHGLQNQMPVSPFWYDPEFSEWVSSYKQQ